MEYVIELGNLRKLRVIGRYRHSLTTVQIVDGRKIFKFSTNFNCYLLEQDTRDYFTEFLAMGNFVEVNANLYSPALVYEGLFYALDCRQMFGIAFLKWNSFQIETCSILYCVHLVVFCAIWVETRLWHNLQEALPCKKPLLSKFYVCNFKFRVIYCWDNTNLTRKYSWRYGGTNPLNH